MSDVSRLLEQSQPEFSHWEKIKDVMDQVIDLMLNYRQSGHPGGSRSKVHAMIALALSGAMRWDIRHPEKRFADRFILSAGHTAPLIYSFLCVMGDAMRTRYSRTGDQRFEIPPEKIVLWEDIQTFRRRGGLPGHAEMAGKTLFLKANTGPSGHGIPVAAGEALSLKCAGAEQVKVFLMEGEGGLTPGAAHETRNSAYGLGLSNLVLCVDWNDFGIDDQAVSDVVKGSPETWFEPAGWKVTGTCHGENWAELTSVLLDAARGDNPRNAPTMVWAKTRKGRGYRKYDNKSHGSPHAMNSQLFWQCRQDFADKYPVQWDSFGASAADNEEMTRQLNANLNVALDVIRNDDSCLMYLTDRLLELAETVPETIDTYRLNGSNPFKDPELTDFRNYPDEIWKAPGSKVPNRAALGAWGAWVNSWAKARYGRPVFLACSADLAGSTNIAGFADGFGELPGWGWYDRDKNPEGTVLPQEITEFANAGLMCGCATVNLAENPYEEWNGFMGACSTYGSFVYLKYGPMRLLSQTDQDTEFKLGKVIWVAGHSGPETADDSRTHFGVFSPGVTQLFPDGHVIDVHPWEYNEVSVVIAAALQTPQPIVALHLTRPPVEIPDRSALGIPSHFEAARGAYIVRDYDPDQAPMGCFIVQGTSVMANLIELLPELDRSHLNIKIVAAVSVQLFKLQPETYRHSVLTPGDYLNSTIICNRSRKVTREWVFNPLAEEYAMTSDWDDRWRTGGNLGEVIDEARLTAAWLKKGIERFAEDKDLRMRRLRTMLEEGERHG